MGRRSRRIRSASSRSPGGAGGLRTLVPGYGGLTRRQAVQLIDDSVQIHPAGLDVLVWDRLGTHVSRTMQQLVAAFPWLTVFWLPAYASELNPVEGVWPQCRRSLANLTAGTVSRLEALVRNRLESLQHRPAALDGFMTETGLPPR
ncbi:transposase [Streptomyces sp. NPDC001292]|uniref:transposase n=1 Tax=Streptomyces sp. NPDC001292 TaxID=3364558 RepID=UPI0036B00B68